MDSMYCLKTVFQHLDDCFPGSHNRTKHIDIKFHNVREALEDGIIDLTYCPTEQMTADMLTKPIARQQFETFRLKMGLKNMPSIKSI